MIAHLILPSLTGEMGARMALGPAEDMWSLIGRKPTNVEAIARGDFDRPPEEMTSGDADKAA